ncbi:hypothetical protein T440DRAFT_382503 [Plenodomus tracheiphilus IPT5]|uniref:Alpha/beta-hydrolase n=1 Tax=Plenodomus tracheiphilus IPT5 TaxID=1408161 RepID=A0A6A7BNS2_9PLEO|nr:hypothetical protein T440DRAFT_382503 [Plenodomus tracheiphilus IPT5]
MHRPQDAHYSFTIPSIHDDTTLDCRLHHPEHLSRPAGDGGGVPWRSRGIIMAHPYAPMGGSYDDRVVGIVVDGFLRAGWIVGTFNFRGAHGSKGRTSWSGKPELDDYSSFAAFFMHYMSYLQPFPTSDTQFAPELSPVSPQRPVIGNLFHTQSPANPVVVLGGYSYGSLIVKHLPPVPTMLQPFAAPMPGSSAAEILLRAHKLADQSNLEWINLAHDEARARQKRRGHDHKPSMTMGGEETTPEKRRSSRDIQRSLDSHSSLNLRTRLRSISHRRREDDITITSPSEKNHTTIVVPDIRYLLISPLTIPVSTLLAPALGHKFWHKATEVSQEVIGRQPSLAIYGGQDAFSSAKKLRDWSNSLKTGISSSFSSVEVTGAGHFWVEPRVEETLRATLQEWESSIR